MATVIVSGDLMLTPTLVLGIETQREGGNQIHPVLGRPNPDVTLRPAGLRTGTLTLGFQGEGSETVSAQAEELHANGGVFTIVSDDRETLSFSYVVSGRISRELDDASRDAWTLTVDFTEVSAT